MTPLFRNEAFTLDEESPAVDPKLPQYENIRHVIARTNSLPNLALMSKYAGLPGIAQSRRTASINSLRDINEPPTYTRDIYWSQILYTPVFDCLKHVKFTVNLLNGFILEQTCEMTHIIWKSVDPSWLKSVNWSNKLVRGSLRAKGLEVKCWEILCEIEI